MKQTLLLLAIIFSLNVTAQINDYMFIGKPDTVKVIMLVGDTGQIQKVYQTKHCEGISYQTRYCGEYVNVDKGNNKFGEVYWQYGYKVQNVNKPTTYLDDKKKPLLPSIIVWQSKNL